MAKYTRSDIIADAATKTGTTKAQAEQIIKAALGLIEDAVRAGSTVELKGFATFKPVERKARLGRNLHTGEPIQIPAKKACTIKAKFKLDA